MKARYIKSSFYSHNVKIRIEGVRLGRLVGSAIKSGVVFKDVVMVSSTELTCVVSYEDYVKLKNAGRAAFRVTILREDGASYRLKKILKKPLGMIGILLVITIVASQSFLVKVIEVSGYEAVPETALRECLAEMGVTEGAYIPKIDWDKAQDEIYKIFPQVVWAKLAYSGRRVLLEVSETASPLIGEGTASGSGGEDDGGQPPEDAATVEYSNIVAAEEGYVETISVHRGVGMVERADFVEKGEILISGYVPIEPTTYGEDDPNFYLVNASGEVWARVPYRLTFNQEKLTWDGREKTSEEVEKRAEQQIRAWAEENLDERAEIVNKSLNFSVNNNIIVVGVTIEVRREIGIIQEEIIGKDYSDTGRD